MLYTRASRRGWVRNADVHRRREDGSGGARPTVVNGAVRVRVRSGVGHGADVRGACSAVMVVVLDGVTASGILLEELVDFSRFARIAIPSEDHSAAYHDGESQDESDHAKDHADGAFVREKAFRGGRAGGGVCGNDSLGGGRVREESGTGTEVCE